jgi:hypothetical protein
MPSPAAIYKSLETKKNIPVGSASGCTNISYSTDADSISFHIGPYPISNIDC